MSFATPTAPPPSSNSTSPRTTLTSLTSSPPPASLPPPPLEPPSSYPTPPVISSPTTSTPPPPSTYYTSPPSPEAPPPSPEAPPPSLTIYSTSPPLMIYYTSPPSPEAPLPALPSPTSSPPLASSLLPPPELPSSYPPSPVTPYPTSSPPPTPSPTNSPLPTRSTPSSSPPLPPTPPDVTRSPPPLSEMTRSSPPPSSPPSSSSGLSTGLVVGIAIGGVLILAFISILFVCYKKKRRRDQRPAGYCVPPPPGPKDDPYGGQPQQWQHNAPPPGQHVITMPPKPSPPPAAVSRPPHSPVRAPSPQASPPPPSMSSSRGSGSNYSGGSNPFPPPSLGFSKSTFSYEELAVATDGFSDANLLGQGGFGLVHRGVLPNGKEVAVKQLRAGSGQGEREFQAEIEIISRVHHKHLVSLVGYCMTGSQRLLVYEFVPNNTLEFHLHGKGRPTMGWSTRLRIALGSAKGLAYIHEDCHPKIIHRDIKAANILLDFNFEVKVGDFGLAKFTSDAATHISTRVMGTFGYLAPEYAASGQLTEKSDVFSFGVMLLEMITGRRPYDKHQTSMDDSLVDWARPLLTRALEEGNFDTLVDQRLQNDYDQNEMARMVACAAACVQHSSRRRPRMSQVVRALEGDVSLSDLNKE
ncbi:hypothetical protein RJ640_024308 [Escallonia rubra]|uniref:non-specific serine/threonine protein kinase n=1 Tax=Escallonia rubra TaxID=112253 RepID=A0AA88RAP7_9ASTE|nr:hypothetical protein RJ640_024308 [Escallonia rubra]